MDQLSPMLLGYAANFSFMKMEALSGFVYFSLHLWKYRLGFVPVGHMKFAKTKLDVL